MKKPFTERGAKGAILALGFYMVLGAVLCVGCSLVDEERASVVLGHGLIGVVLGWLVWGFAV